MTTRCPECGTEQRSDAPFCENCGYRLRSAETLAEGLPQISPEMLRASVHTPARPETVTTEEAKALDDPASHRPGGSRIDTAPEGYPHVGPSTIMEGMSAIHAPPQTSQESRYDPSPTPSASTSGSFIGIAPPGAANSGPSLVAFGVVWSVITAVGVLVAWAALREPTSPDEQVEVAEQSKLEIPAGTFRRGLDTRTRARILRTCMKGADDPDTECEQDTLLAGEFPDEDVTLEAFAIDALETSVAGYDECVSAGACTKPDYKGCRVYTHQGFQVSLRVPKSLKERAHPQVCVTRAEALAYCTHRGGSLPSHDQWERAARGEDTFLFPWDNTWSAELANWAEADITQTHVVGKLDGHAWTAPVGSYPDGRSPTGAWDMAGNASEWVAGSEDKGHARGGSWISDPFALRTTARIEVSADERRTDVGFRCVYGSGGT